MEKNSKRNFYSLDEVRTEVFNNCLSKAGIYLAAKRGDIPTITIGRRILVPASFVEKIIAQ